MSDPRPSSPMCVAFPLFLLAAFTLGLRALAAPATPARPNVVFIRTDNQGAWPPAAAIPSARPRPPLFSPASSHRNRTANPRGPAIMMGPRAFNTLPEFALLGEIFRDAGYACGLSEHFNLLGQPGTETKRAELAGRLDAFFATYADPRFDRWKGGRNAAQLPNP